MLTNIENITYIFIFSRTFKKNKRFYIIFRVIFTLKG